MKRFICVILALSMLAGMFSVTASAENIAPSIYYSAFFGEFTDADKIPYTLRVKGKDENNTVVSGDGFINMLSKGNGSPSLEFRTGKKITNLMLHISLSFEEYSSDTALWLSNYDDELGRLMLFTSLGGIKAADGGSMTQVGTFSKGEWLSIDAAISGDTYSLYINGEKVIDNKKLPLKTNEGAAVVWEKNIQSFKIDTYNRTGKDTSVNFREFVVYSGTEVVSVEELEKAAEPVVIVEDPDEESEEDSVVIYANNNFNALEAGSSNIGIGGDKKTNLAYVDEFPSEEDKSVKLESVTSDTFNVLTSFDTSMKGQFIWDFKVLFDDLESKATLTLRDPAPLFIDAVSFLTGGQVRNSNNENIATYTVNTWYRLQLVVDVAEKKYSFYMDGQKLVDNAPLNSALSSVGLIRFHIYPPSNGGSSIHIDDWRVYEGNEFLTDEYLAKKGSVAGGSHYVDHGRMESLFNGKYAFAPDAPYYYSQNKRVMYNAEDRSVKARTINDSLYIPLRGFVESEGGSVNWNNGVTDAVLNEKTINVASDGTCTLDGGKIDKKAQMYGDLTYIPVELISSAENSVVTSAYMDMCIVEKEDDKIDLSKWNSYAAEMYRYLLYDHPTQQTIMEMLQTKYPDNEHPRIMVEPGTFEEIKNNIPNDENMQKWYDSMIKSADEMLTAAPIEYTPAKGDTLLESARTMLSRSRTLGLAYQLTKEEKYKDALWDNLSNVCSFQDWYPTHFLDVGEMSLAVAIGYDWLYNEWTKEERKILENAIETKGLEVTLEQYETDNQAGYWTVTDNNWNVVCNGGAAVAALAIGDKNPELVGKVVYYALWGLESMMKEYAPDGGWNEGITYWQYTNSYFTYLMSSLNTALGSDFGFVESPGVARTGMFPIDGTGPKGIFNYHDAGTAYYSSADTLWMSSRLNDPELTANNLYNREIYDMGGGAQELIWYDPEMNDGTEPTLEKDTVYNGVELAFMRSSFEDLNGIFVGLHGGLNSVNHGSLDNGTFVLDAIGERWFLDLGGDSYSLPEYFAGKRYNYYRNRAEGHNTLVINPGSGNDQIASATGVITEQFSKPRGAYSILDMTPAYEGANSIRRGMMLSNDRTIVTVRDEFDLEQNSELYWFAHTKADIEISEDGKSAILTIGNKQLYAELSTDLDAKFSVMDAKPLSTSPQYSGQNSNSGVRKLAIHSDSAKKGYIQVSFEPILIYGEEPNKNLIPEPMSFNEWAQYIPDGEIQPFGVDSITIDGEQVPDFDMDNLVYKIKYPFGTTHIPTVEATSDKYDVSVEQATTMPGSARIKVTDRENPDRTISYLIEFTVLPQIGNKPEGSKEITPVAITASDVPQPENSPENSIDGDLSTRWSAFGVQWIEYDLGAEYDVTHIELAWMNGETRVYPFEIYVSSDGENYTNILRTESSATTNDMEIHQLPETKARYVRVKCFGNNENEWNSLTEAKIYVKE